MGFGEGIFFSNLTGGGNANEKKPRNPFSVEVKEGVEKVAANTYKVVLKVPEGFGEFKPGQAIKILVEDGEGKTERKSFTIASAPHENVLEIIFRVPEDKKDWSATKRALMGVQTGGKLEILGVFPDFRDEMLYPENEPTETPVVALVAGTGMTAILPMLRHAKHTGDKDRRWHIMYTERDADHVILNKNSDEYKGYAKDLNLEMQTTLTRGAGNGFGSGRYTKEDIQEVMDQYETMPLFFVAGPPNMVTETVQLLSDLGIDTDARVRRKEYKGGDYGEGDYY